MYSGFLVHHDELILLGLLDVLGAIHHLGFLRRVGELWANGFLFYFG
jgi:hypothetical protein